MADRDRESGSISAGLIKLYHFLSRSDVVAAAYILVLCAAFVLETRGLRNLFYALALPLFLLFLLSLRQLDLRALWRSPVVKLAFAYLGYFLLSALWSHDFAWSALADLLRVSVLAALFFVVTASLALRWEAFEKQLFFWFALAGGASLLFLFATLILGTPPYYQRLTGFGLAAHPIIGASLYGIVVLISAFYLLPRAEGNGQRLLWLAVIGLAIAFILQAGSRGPLIALVAALLIAGVLAHRLATAAVIGLLGVGMLIGVLSDFLPIKLLYLRAPSGHFELWAQALDAIRDKPWFGHGSLTDFSFASPYGPQRSAHNLILSNQLYGGIPASLLLLALLAAAGLRAYRAARGGAAVYLLLLVFAFIASLFDSRSLFQNLGREWVTFWLPLGLLAALEVRDRATGAAAQSAAKPA